MVARVVAWGGYDDSKPRVRLLLDALRRHGALAGEIHVPVWREIEDKSVAGKAKLLRAAGRWLAGMPRALWRLATLPRGQDLLLPYPGTPEIFLAAPFAWLAGRKIVLDAFLPIHDTIVRDRGLVREGGAIARLIRSYEWLGLALADVILVDTDQHGDFLAQEYGFARGRFETVLVGAEAQFTPSRDLAPVDDLIGPPDGRPVILFYGQLIPLHGLSTILEAARLTGDAGLRWIMVGKGQQENVLRQFLETGGDRHVTWVPWVEYRRLPALIARSDLCLGVFGASDKAGRVIPNKLFQVLAMGKRVVTRSSAAVDDLARCFPEHLVTVPADDPAALATAISAILADGDSVASTLLPQAVPGEFGPAPGVARLIARLERAGE